MRLNSQYPTQNFTSISRDYSTVLKRTASGIYEPVPVVIKELSPKSSQDYKILKKLVKLWDIKGFWNGECAGFASYIKNEFKNLSFHAEKGLKYYDNSSTEINDYVAKDIGTIKKFYVVETRDNAKVKEHKNILGIIQYCESVNNEANEIAWLQIHPQFTFQNKSTKRKYKGIGTILVDFVKKISQNQITVEAYYSAIDFYLKSGFQCISRDHPTNLVFDPTSAKQ